MVTTTTTTYHDKCSYDYEHVKDFDEVHYHEYPRLMLQPLSAPFSEHAYYSYYVLLLTCFLFLPLMLSVAPAVKSEVGRAGLSATPKT